MPSFLILSYFAEDLGFSSICHGRSLSFSNTLATTFVLREVQGRPGSLENPEEKDQM